MAEGASQNGTRTRWTARRERAARLVAEDELIDAEIAAEVGVSRTALEQWKRRPEFRARVESLVAEVRAAALRHAIARKNRRLKELQDRHDRLKLIVTERGQDPSHAAAPGGKGGLLVRRLKSVGSGENARVVEEFEADVALSREMREIERQAAVEVGDWDEGGGGSSGPPAVVVILGVNPDKALGRVPQALPGPPAEGRPGD